MKSYDEYVSRYANSFTKVLIDKDYYEKIQSFVEKLTSKKVMESHHRFDHFSETKRFTTGLLGEAALEKLLGISIIDWTIGESSTYHHPDIPGYTVGIKTVERGKFPIVFKDNYYPQIICIRSDKVPNLIFVCGLATTDVLNNYQDDNLIIDPNLRARGTKTGFYGFSELTPIQSINDLTQYERK